LLPDENQNPNKILGFFLEKEEENPTKQNKKESILGFNCKYTVVLEMR